MIAILTLDPQTLDILASKAPEWMTPKPPDPALNMEQVSKVAYLPLSGRHRGVWVWHQFIY